MKFFSKQIPKEYGPLYAGLFFTALATLMYEILLTRIFSVTMWYHFAFMAISVALFGMTVGAIIVYVKSNYFTKERAQQQATLFSLAFAVSIIASFLMYRIIPFHPNLDLTQLYAFGLIYIIITIPFVLSGIVITVVLTKFVERVSSLYAWDLIGAALGTVALVGVLHFVDAPTTVFVVGLLASLGAVSFSWNKELHWKYASIALSVIILASVGALIYLAKSNSSPLNLQYVKGRYERAVLYEKWNAFSRILINGDPERWIDPVGGSLSGSIENVPQVQQLQLTIDASAATHLTKFDGDTSRLEFLKYDLTNAVHYLREKAHVLVVGSGAGRDILSALVFDQAKITGVELNKNINKAVHGVFGDYTGNLDKYEHINFVSDEARSFISRSDEEFDIIQISLIDTWAATAAGAFALSENNLYTIEAWQTFFDHLSENGVLTITRWYYEPLPSETYRLIGLAADSLREYGIENPQDHIMLLVNYNFFVGHKNNFMAVLLTSPEPFSEKDVAVIEELASTMDYDVLISPDVVADDAVLAELVQPQPDLTKLELPILLTAPTDNQPFFFQMLKFGSIATALQIEDVIAGHNMTAILILLTLLGIVTILTLLFIVLPLVFTTKMSVLKGSASLFTFFISIGFGFMLLEIALLQRLIVYLGHPTYALTVVLFTILLASGVGSYTTKHISSKQLSKYGVQRIALIVVVAILVGLLTPWIAQQYDSVALGWRIVLSVLLLAPLGWVLGMAFPLGMKAASAQSDQLTPWLWGVNGATSVCASVLAVVIAIAAGIATSYWIGVLWYVVALLVFWRQTKKN